MRGWPLVPSFFRPVSKSIIYAKPYACFLVTCFAIVTGDLPTDSAVAEIRIGIAAPLTGPRAWAGEQTRAGAEAAAQDLNLHGGILGEMLTTVLADDFCEPAQAEAAARKLVADGVTLVVGHQCSGAALSASLIYEKTGIIFISPKATNPQLTERGLKLTFRTCGRDDDQAAMIAKHIADKWADARIAIIHDGQAYGRGLAEDVKRRLEELGTIVTRYDEVEPGQVDFTQLVSAIETHRIEIVFFSGYQAEAGLIVRQAKERMSALAFIVPDAVAYEDFWLIAGEAAENTRMTQLMNPAKNSDAAEVVAKLTAGGIDPSGATLYAYAAVQAWSQGVAAAHTTEASRIAAILRSRRFDTVLGKIGFDEKGDVVGFRPFTWYVWRGGGYIEE